MTTTRLARGARDKGRILSGVEIDALYPGRVYVPNVHKAPAPTLALCKKVSRDVGVACLVVGGDGEVMTPNHYARHNAAVDSPVNQPGATHEDYGQDGNWQSPGGNVMTPATRLDPDTDAAVIACGKRDQDSGHDDGDRAMRDYLAMRAQS